MKLSLCKIWISKPEVGNSKKTGNEEFQKPEMRKSLIFPLKKSSQHSDIDYL